MSATHFDAHSPERGWPPFLDWLRDHDLDPGTVRALIVENDRVSAEVFVRGDDGLLVVDGDEVRTRPVVVNLRSAPPLHPSRKAAS